jgi:DNA-binding response OmpR family regulator
MRLLIAEDDPGLRRVLVRGLTEASYVVDAVIDGEQAVEHLRLIEYGVCILDWRIPRRSGLEVLQWARRARISTPVLMLTARDTAPDRIEALDEGADDYLVKPFDFGELLARIRALLRRPPGERAPLLRCGDLQLDPATHMVSLGTQLVDLTPRELAVVELLLRRSPAIVNRRTIAQHGWPDDSMAVGSNTIDVHIARLRAKLAGAAVRIETLRGLGYRLREVP